MIKQLLIYILCFFVYIFVSALFIGSLGFLLLVVIGLISFEPNTFIYAIYAGTLGMSSAYLKKHLESYLELK